MRKQSPKTWYAAVAVFVVAAALPVLLLGEIDGWLHWDTVLLGIGMIGLLIAVAWINVDMLRFLARAAEKRTPAQILDERLARGEIDLEEYNRLRDVLQGAAQ